MAVAQPCVFKDFTCPCWSPVELQPTITINARMPPCCFMPFCIWPWCHLLTCVLTGRVLTGRCVDTYELGVFFDVFLYWLFPRTRSGNCRIVSIVKFQVTAFLLFVALCDPFARGSRIVFLTLDDNVSVASSITTAIQHKDQTGHPHQKFAGKSHCAQNRCCDVEFAPKVNLCSVILHLSCFCILESFCSISIII